MKRPNLTDGQKMIVASVVVVAMSFLVAFIVGVGEWRGEISEAGRARAGSIYTTLTQANEQLLQARRAEKDFLLRSEPKYIEKARAYSAQLQKVLGSLDSAGISGDQREQLAQMQAAATNYRNAFDQMTATAVELGLNENEGMEGKLRDAVHNIEAVLKETNQVTLTASMLMMRRREKDFMLRGKDKYVALLNEETKTFLGLLGQAKGIPAGTRQTIVNNLETYRTTFNTYAEKALQLAKEKHALSEASHALEPLIDSLQSKGLANYSAHTQDAAEFRTQLRYALAAGVLFASLVSVVVLWWLNRSIRHSIGIVVTQLQSASNGMGSASAQVSASSQALAAGASEQAASLEETTSTLEEIAGMARQNSEHIAQADGESRSAQELAGTGSDSIQRMVTSIGEIKAASDATAKIIKTIDEIAFQTNLLSLNASVEAARAGEAGKGFAVVAEEVRNLARRSAEAARSTSDLVESGQKKADAGVAVAREVEAAFSSIQATIQRVGELMNHVAKGSKEQAQGVEQITTAAAQLNEVTQSNAANAEETAAASQEMSSQAEMLDAIVQRLAGLSGGVKTTQDDRDDEVRKVVKGHGKHAPHALPAPTTGLGKAPSAARAKGHGGTGHGDNGHGGNDKRHTSLRDQIAEDWQRSGGSPVAIADTLTDADFTDIRN